MSTGCCTGWSLPFLCAPHINHFYVYLQSKFHIKNAFKEEATEPEYRWFGYAAGSSGLFGFEKFLKEFLCEMQFFFII